MEYEVGSIAALISGNVTPSRPKHLRRALTPTKHQPSPNVTPKSEVADRSIFLSPTLQKKKAIVKKSPKRIFENPDLDVTDEGNPILLSPKADKVKKHLKIELEANTSVKPSLLSPESPKDNSEMLNKSPKKMPKINSAKANETENSPQKDHNSKKKKRKQPKQDEPVAEINVESIETDVSPKKKRKQGKPLSQNNDNINNINKDTVKSPKKGKKTQAVEESLSTEVAINPKKQNKKNKSKTPEEPTVTEVQNNPKKQIKKKNKGKKNKNQLKTEEVNKQSKIQTEDESDKEDADDNEDYVNPNAITSQDTDSEHDSDDEMESENDKANEKVLQPEESSDEEEEKEVKKEKPVQEKKETALTDDEVKRTIFVGNVPFSKKCKKEIKKIFSEFGSIETVRIRTVPVKDARVTPKMALIKSELHPDRSTVNVYVKFAKADSVDKALSANNTVLNEHHLRVSRSDCTGVPHDPKCSVFVGNIPFALEDEALRAKFEKCGDIESVRIVRDRKTNAGKGFGYVNFASKDGVELALALTEEDLTIKNRIMRVKRCTQTQGTKTKGPPRKTLLQFVSRSKVNKIRPRENKNDGAYRRIAKRKNQEQGDGPANKRPRDIKQPKEKKPRKEFVGMTAEKKKKNKFNKGQKKKKVLSEIMTKK